jgi:DNA-directed RNA polymerase specialized sigma24 family protein
MGKVERAWRARAYKLGRDPRELLESMIVEGVTQTQIAEQLNCTRQAVAVMASRHGLEFPGARLDVDAAAEVHGCKSFEDYMDQFWGELTQEQMAEQLEVSLSTLKRRIKCVQDRREGLI